jgi:CRP-like cAMP-binding protein
MPLDRSLISSLPLFDGFAPEALDEMLAEARSQRTPKGVHVFAQGAQATSYFLLLHGRVRACKVTSAGEQIVMRFVGPGELFGVAPAIGAKVYPANAVAAVDSVVLAWPAAAWSALAARHSSLAAGLMRALGERLEEAQTRIAEMSTQAVERRVANALLRLAAQGGRREGEGVAFDFPISQQDIAEMTATTLFTVSRIFTAWEAAGLIATGRQKILIRDPHGLAVLAEGLPDRRIPRSRAAERIAEPA